MSVFAVIEDRANSRLADNIREQYPEDHLELASGHWLVSAPKTAQELSDGLGLDKGSGFGSTLVLRVSSYYGLHSTDTWDWLKSRMED